LVFRETGALVGSAPVDNVAGGYVLFRLVNIASYIVGMLLVGMANRGARQQDSSTVVL
jgi:hypothetical protein